MLCWKIIPIFTVVMYHIVVVDIHVSNHADWMYTTSPACSEKTIYNLYSSKREGLFVKEVKTLFSHWESLKSLNQIIFLEILGIGGP